MKRLGWVDGVSGTFGGKATFVNFLATNSPAVSGAVRCVLTVRRTKYSLVRVNVPFSSPVTRNIMVRSTGIHTLGRSAAASSMFRVMEGIHRGASVPLMFLACVGPIFFCNCRRFFGGYNRLKVSNVVSPSLPCRRGNRVGSVTLGGSISIVSLVTPASDREVGVVTGSTAKFVCIMSSLNIANVHSRVGASLGTVLSSVHRMASLPLTINFNVGAPRRTRSVSGVTSNIVIKDTVMGVVRRRNRGTDRTLGRCISDVGGTYGGWGSGLVVCGRRVWLRCLWRSCLYLGRGWIVLMFWGPILVLFRPLLVGCGFGLAIET